MAVNKTQQEANILMARLLTEDTDTLEFQNFLISLNAPMKWKFIRLCEAYEAHLSEKIDNFDLQTIFFILFPENKEYDASLMGLIFRAFVQKLEIYFEYIQGKELKVRDFKNGRFFWLAIEQGLQNAKLKPEATYFRETAELHEAAYFFEVEGGSKDRKHLVKSRYFNKCYRVLKDLKTGIELIWRDILDGNPPNEELCKELRETIKKAPLDEPIILLFVFVAEFYLSPNLEKYNQCKTTFLEHFDELRSEQRTIFLWMVNALVLMRSFGINYPVEYLEWYKFGDLKEILLENGFIAMKEYLNILNVAFTVGSFDWQKSFTNNYADLLEVELKTKQFLQNLSKCYFLWEQKKFKEGLQVLNTIKGNNYRFTVFRNVLRMKFLYEENPKDSLPEIASIADSFRNSLNRYLRSNLLNEKEWEQNKNFIKIIVWIAKYHTIDNKKSKEELLGSLESKRGKIVEYFWLKEKILELPDKKARR